VDTRLQKNGVQVNKYALSILYPNKYYHFLSGFIETSAKLPKNVSEAFYEAVRVINKRYPKKVRRGTKCVLL